jgi:hypothetical protein
MRAADTAERQDAPGAASQHVAEHELELARGVAAAHVARAVIAFDPDGSGVQIRFEARQPLDRRGARQRHPRQAFAQLRVGSEQFGCRIARHVRPRH